MLEVSKSVGSSSRARHVSGLSSFYPEVVCADQQVLNRLFITFSLDSSGTREIMYGRKPPMENHCVLKAMSSLVEQALLLEQELSASDWRIPIAILVICSIITYWKKD
ncbi:unnamed protein product [Lactuca saligna]|uniref:Uncharacterized protein n=1 Tax=Lactuca saligna TaxID=75948 RepID=A0AA36E6C1_LACSI|nr:unnamed protein product [Lactuca saligna]